MACRPAGIVAFTFTERAAAELRHRIAERAAEVVGPQILDQFGGLFVGTIHAYCFRLLQTHVPRYETYDVLDDNQLTAFLAREAHRLDIRQLDANKRLFGSIARFLQGVDVVENELLDPESMPEPFRQVLLGYLDTLERYRLLTYGQQIVRAVQALEDPVVLAKVRATLRHLIVDEYQDVNPAQERLIATLAGPDVELCVVGDDDQAIYQWRGSDVGNIVTFTDRYEGVATFEIVTNRRSRPTIIETANAFATHDPGPADQGHGHLPASRRSTGGRRLACRHRASRGRVDRRQGARPPRRRRCLPGHRRAGPDAGCVPGDRRRLQHVRHPGAARRAHRPVRPARGSRRRADVRLDDRCRLARRVRTRAVPSRKTTLLDDYQRLFELDGASENPAAPLSPLMA